MSIGHVALIMDGNGRWAARRGRPRWMGHVRGAQAARRVVEHCTRRGVRQLTLYAFSSDNWKRPADEVRVILELLASHLASERETLRRNGIQLEVVGRRDRLPADLVAAIEATERATAGGRRMQLRVAIDYSSRLAILNALSLGERPSDISGAGSILPPVDLLIRTGGERRLSDFLLWECAYAELAFLDVSFPDVSVQDLDQVFDDFATRERRFGAVVMQEGA